MIEHISVQRLIRLTVAAAAAAAAAILFTGSPLNAEESPPCEKGFKSTTTDIRPDMELHRHQCEKPLYRAFVLEIDLTSEDLDIFVTPYKTGRVTTSKFAEKFGAFAAVNGGFLGKKGGYTVSSGKKWPKRNDTAYGAVVGFGKNGSPDGKWRIDIRPPKEVLCKVPSWMTHAVTGYPLVLSKGKAIGCDEELGKYRHPRTGIGYTKDRETLFLVVVDGRRKGWSWGLKTVQMGKLFRSLGAYRAVNLDGGGSSTMVIPSQGDLINKPCARKGPERKVLNHLGIMVKGWESTSALLKRIFKPLFS
jgi:exopolysaccharide biosynthesis protein